jgi:excisionase family DNA binding protein
MLNEQDSKCERMAYSLKEAAEMLGVSQGHLRNENRRGLLVLVHTGRCTRILSEDLKRYLVGLKRG